MSDKGQAREDVVHHGGVRWVRVSRGFYLLGFGTFLLLTTQDVLPLSFWSDALAYWPVLLVACGIRLVFERSAAPGLVLLGPALVLGTLMHVAMQGPGHTEADHAWVPLKAEGAADVPDWTLEGRLALARVDVTSRRLPRGVLAEGRGTEAGRHSVRLAGDAAAGRVQVTNSWYGKTFFAMPGRRGRCELGVTTALPVAFDLDLAFTTTRFDVATGPVSRVTLDGAFNDLTLRLGEPSSDVVLDFQGAFNLVAIEVPATTPVRVNSEGFLNFVDGRRRNRRPPGGSPGYRVQLDGAFNRVVVRSWDRE